MRFSHEIDGLRAVAVLAVVFCHALPPVCPGGFLGVDIFFVISGFLISSIIRDELRSGTFTIAGFFERRARRIIPALAVMLVVVAVAGWFILLPEDLKQLGRAFAAAAASIANLHYHGNQDYFAPDAATQPLLHTWSLAVEEQFYLIVAPVQALERRVWISLPVPEMAEDVPRSVALAMWHGRDPYDIRLDSADYRVRHDWFLRMCVQLRDNGAQVVDPASVLLRDGGYRVLFAGRILYRDDHHLSHAGAQLVAPVFAGAFRRP